MTTTIFDSGRRQVKRNRPFARGVFTERPFRPTDSDAIEAAAMFDEQAAIDRELDLMWLEAQALDRLTAGLDA